MHDMEMLEWYDALIYIFCLRMITNDVFSMRHIVNVMFAIRMITNDVFIMEIMVSEKVQINQDLLNFSKNDRFYF